MHARVTTQIRMRPVAAPVSSTGQALRVAVSGRHAPMRGLKGRPACRCATREHPRLRGGRTLAAGHGNVARPDSGGRP